MAFEPYNLTAGDVRGDDRTEEDMLWDALKLLEGCVFYTAKGLAYTYKIRGGELFVDRKEKSITQSSVNMAYHRAMELGGIVMGPKKLGTFGASYLYPIFIRMGVIRTEEQAGKGDC